MSLVTKLVLDASDCRMQEVVEAPKKMGPDALLKDKFKANRQRQGYEEGISTSHRTAPATSFVLSEAPVEMLGRFTRCAGLWSDAVPNTALHVLVAMAMAICSPDVSCGART
jgi:Domain of unknown function (DUF3381)